MKEVCQTYWRATAASSLPRHLNQLVMPPSEPEFKRIANAFVELQEARHTADYDAGALFDRNDVLQKIDLAERAFSDWNIIKSKPNANVFLAALLLNSLWRK
ncbi:MAG: hypothetical protein WA827_13070 [Candidatus Binatus sp.]|jgi:hypothetical protein